MAWLWGRQVSILLLCLFGLCATPTAQAQTTDPNDNPDTSQPSPFEFHIRLGLSGYLPMVNLNEGRLHIEIAPSLDLIGATDQIQLHASVFVYLDEDLLNTFDFGLALGASNLVRDPFRFPTQGCTIETNLSLRLYTRSVAGCALQLEDALILTMQLQLTRLRVGLPGTAGTFESALTFRMPFEVSLVPDLALLHGIRFTAFGIVRGIGFGGVFGGGVRINFDLGLFGQRVSPGIELEGLVSATSLVPSGFRVSIVMGSSFILRPEIVLLK